MSNTLLTQHANTSIWSSPFTPPWHTYRFQQQSHLIEMLMILGMKICYVCDLLLSWYQWAWWMLVGLKEKRKSNRTTKIKSRMRKQTQNNNVCFNFAGTTWNFIGFFFFCTADEFRNKRLQRNPADPHNWSLVNHMKVKLHLINDIIVPCVLILLFPDETSFVASFKISTGAANATREMMVLEDDCPLGSCPGG